MEKATKIFWGGWAALMAAGALVAMFDRPSTPDYYPVAYTPTPPLYEAPEAEPPVPSQATLLPVAYYAPDPAFELGAFANDGVVASSSRIVPVEVLPPPEVTPELAAYAETATSSADSATYAVADTAASRSPPPSTYTPPPPSSFYAPPSPPARLAPACAENGSCYGDISAATGRPRTVHVQGYYRRDGTYVRGHYRSRPGG